MSIFTKFTQMFGSAQVAETAEDRLLAHTIEMTDTRLASIPGYGDALYPLIDQARSYYEQALSLLPGPVNLADSENQALLDVIFPNPEDISAGLGRSLEVKQQLPALLEQGHPHLFALLGLRARTQPEATEAVLIDHTFRSLAPGVNAVREALRDAAYNGLLQGFANATSYRQQKLELMQGQKELVNETVSSHQVRVAGIAQSIDAHISRANKDLTPEKVLDNLKEWLRGPEAYLRLDNRTGHSIRTAADTPAMHLPLLTSQDRRQWLVCLTEFPIELAQEAVARESRTHRFIMI